MKQFTAILLVVITCLACNNPSQEKTVKTDSSSVTTQMDSSSDERKILIEELRKLGSTLASGDKNKIADIFTFPMADTTFGIYLGDTLQMEYEKNGNAITRDMFVKHYKTFAEAQDFNGLTELFKRIPLDSLQFKGRLERSVKKKGEPCIEAYSIEISTDTVYLQSGLGGLADPESADADIACEYASFWRFRFDKNRLRFIFHGAAG